MLSYSSNDGSSPTDEVVGYVSVIKGSMGYVLGKHKKALQQIICSSGASVVPPARGKESCFTIRGTGIIFVGPWVALQTIDGTNTTHV